MLEIIFAGTPEFAVPALEALLQSEHRVVAVYTQPDRPAGRGRRLQASPVKRIALDAGIALEQPGDFKSGDALETLRAFGADLMVVAAYGLLLSPAVLAAPRLGCVNIHASLLPRWRGASPIQHAILAGDTVSGITLMKMEQGLDSGDIIASRELVIEPEWNAGDLQDALAPLGAELLREQLPQLETALAEARPQQHDLATYAPRLTKRQAQIDWRKPRAELLREIRAYNPWPVSHTALGAQQLRLWAARAAEIEAHGRPGEIAAHDRDGVFVCCGDALLQLTELQFAGRRRCSAAEALNARNLTGLRLGGDHE